MSLSVLFYCVLCQRLLLRVEIHDVLQYITGNIAALSRKFSQSPGFCLLLARFAEIAITPRVQLPPKISESSASNQYDKWLESSNLLRNCYHISKTLPKKCWASFVKFGSLFGERFFFSRLCQSNSSIVTWVCEFSPRLWCPVRAQLTN